MTNRHPVCRSLMSLPLVLALFGLYNPPAQAAFVPFDLGNWQYDAPAGVAIAETPGRVNKTFGLTLTTTFTDANPKVITFRTTPGRGEDERFFMFNFDITNNLLNGLDWMGFIIKTLDQIEVGPNNQDPQNIIDHPKWAHIHPLHGSPNPGSAMPTGANYTNFTVLNPEVSYGVEVLTLTGGAVFNGDSWLPERIRIHDKNALGDLFISSDQISFDQVGPMEFELVLQPIPVPEPTALALMASGLTLLGAIARRRQPR